MDDSAELQARIAALSGQIKQHRENSAARGRWSPYGRGRGGYAPTHRNRTLVLNGPQAGASLPQSEPKTFVSTRSSGKNQLMTKDAYQRELQHRKEHDGSAPPKPPKAKREAERPALQSRRELMIGGIRFQMAEDGSKLFRIPGDDQEAQETPKTVKIADVAFIRTKRGNLVRAAKNDSRKPTRKPLCEHFTKHGKCSFGPACRFTHDPWKVAICKDFLRNGSCPSGKHCDLSHDPTYHRVPACTHFLRGNCTNDACRYPHVRVSPTAAVCRPFVTLGYCAKGPDCDRRHVIECPDYSNHGHCANQEKGICALPHLDGARNLRKAAKRQGQHVSADDESDISSGDEDDETSIHNFEDSDGPEDVDDIIVEVPGHELTQQEDFVAFR